jgi:hypothetical protein
MEPEEGEREEERGREREREEGTDPTGPLCVRLWKNGRGPRLTLSSSLDLDDSLRFIACALLYSVNFKIETGSAQWILRRNLKMQTSINRVAQQSKREIKVPKT